MTQGYDYGWVKFMVVATVNRRIDAAAEAAGVTRGEWLQRAVLERLNRVEARSEIENEGTST